MDLKEYQKTIESKFPHDRDLQFLVLRLISQCSQYDRGANLRSPNINAIKIKLGEVIMILSLIHSYLGQVFIIRCSMPYSLNCWQNKEEKLSLFQLCGQLANFTTDNDKFDPCYLSLSVQLNYTIDRIQYQIFSEIDRHGFELAEILTINTDRL